MSKVEEFVPRVHPEGQFAAVWVFNGKIWSGTFKWEYNSLYKYDDYNDEWKGGNGYTSLVSKSKIYVLGE